MYSASVVAHNTDTSLIDELTASYIIINKMPQDCLRVKTNFLIISHDLCATLLALSFAMAKNGPRML